jgi:diguanylate cyclase (GGDEF)-like protein
MNIEKFKQFYFVLSRLPVLRKSYALKIMVIACISPAVSLLTLIVYTLFNASDNLNLIVVMLVATLIGSAITLFLLYLVLYPISLTLTALEQYANEQECPQLAIGYEDTVGKLMTHVQYTIEKLDLLNNSHNSPAIDPLTCLPNRLRGIELLRKDVARARREDKPMLVALLEVEQFENLKKTFGHHVADECLAQTVEVISKSIRKGDWLARWDEDKFLMVLWNFNDTTPTAVLMRIQHQSVKLFSTELPQIRLSIGACEYRGDLDLDTKTDLETLLIRVEETLSQVKKGSRGGIVLGGAQRSSFFI